jgi:DNA modification methylase
MFVGHIVLVARALWRVLREDGTFWLNFGDSYCNYRTGYQGALNGQSVHNGEQRGKPSGYNPRRALKHPGLKEKDLIGIPWRVAFALQADGWCLRSDIVWAKGVSFCPTYSGSCMPESVRDRPTKGHEYVFLLSKNKRYFYDGDAVREQETESSRQRYRYMFNHLPRAWETEGATPQTGGKRPPGDQSDKAGAGRNLRSVWTINPGSYAGAHFATFPPALVEPMIKAGTSAKGCCPKCKAPWERVTEKPDMSERPRRSNGSKGIQNAAYQGATSSGQAYQNWRNANPDVTTGWIPTCSCGTERPIPQEELDADPTLLDDFEIEPFEPVPCTVLDPFTGSGTAPDVARQLGRNWIAVELSADYCDDHIIPRLTEPLMEWAEQEQREAEVVQLTF